MEDLRECENIVKSASFEKAIVFDLQQAELTENLEKKVKEKQDKELLVKAIQSICHNTHFFDRESFLGT